MPYRTPLARARGVDDVLIVDDMRFLTVEKIGEKQSWTPEGFLLIQDTPVARAGWQIYAPQEIPEANRFTPPPDGVFRVFRDENEVFASEAMASGNGKPIVDEHPDAIITPDTVGSGPPGVALDPRRGTGIEDDLLIMDLVVYSRSLIDAIREGKRELSLGYDVDYEEIEPGKLAQKNIRINHVALVDSGRCGPRCSIGDHATPTAIEETSMAKTRGSVLDRVKAALKKGGLPLPATFDEEELSKALEEPEVEERDESAASPHHVEIHNHMPATSGAEHDDEPAAGGDVEERVARLETAVHELAEMCKANVAGGTSDEEKEKETEWKKGVDAFMKGARGETDEGNQAILGELELEVPPGAEPVKDVVAKMSDSALMSESFQRVVAIAETLAPGIRVPTFDVKLSPRKGFEVICGLRRSALDLAHGQAETRGFIEEILNGRAFDVKKMSCADTRSLFVAVGAMKRGANNRTVRVGDHFFEQREHGKPVGGVKTLADLNKLYADTYSPKKSAA